ncbi:MAG: hypothetical protein NDI94_01310 [Candidatus Woesearchaeota archaeon]|nr:hypothetical protein [Candidatus Woesearchaeota archaeon]
MRKETKKRLIGYLKLIGIMALLFVIFKGIFILVVLIGLSLSMSYLVNQFKLRNFGIELVTLIAVLVGMKYGPISSLIITFILILYHLAAGGFFGTYWFWVIPSYCLAGVIAGFFQAEDISRLGFFLTLGINIVTSLFTAIATPGFLPKHLPFAVSNVIFNVILFNVLGKTLLLLLI